MTIDITNSVYYFRLSSEKQANTANTIKHYMDRVLKAGFRLDQIYYEVASEAKDDREVFQNILYKVRG